MPLLVIVAAVVTGAVIVMAAGWWLHRQRQRGDTVWPYWLIAIAPAVIPIRTLLVEAFMFALVWVIALLCGWWIRDKRYANNQRDHQ